MHRWSLIVVALFLLIGACADDGQPSTGRSSVVEGRSGIEAYIAAWSDAWSAGDPYDIVRFYDPDVDVRLAQPDRELTQPPGLRVTTTDGIGAAWMARWIETSTETRERRPAAIALDGESAVVVQVIAELETAAWVELVVSSNLIVGQTTLRWRNAFLPGGTADRRYEWLDELVAEELTERWPSASVLTIGAGDRRGPAVFVVPGADPTGAGVVVETSECVRAIWLDLADGEVLGRRDFDGLDCGPVPPRWDELTDPGRLEDRLTGSVNIGGRDISIYSGSPDLERLVEWGVGRFGDFGLAAPNIASVTFAPHPDCPIGIAGRASRDSTGSSHVVLCTDSQTACNADQAGCAGFTTTARFGLLHELAHVWISDELDAAGRSAYVAAFDLPTWADDAMPWGQRGIEHAADTIAWALIDEPVDLVRIGRPSCEAAAAGFSLLTGLDIGDRCDPDP